MPETLTQLAKNLNRKFQGELVALARGDRIECEGENFHAVIVRDGSKYSVTATAFGKRKSFVAANGLAAKILQAREDLRRAQTPLLQERTTTKTLPHTEDAFALAGYRFPKPSSIPEDTRIFVPLTEEITEQEVVDDAIKRGEAWAEDLGGDGTLKCESFFDTVVCTLPNEPGVSAQAQTAGSFVKIVAKAEGGGRSRKILAAPEGARQIIIEAITQLAHTEGSDFAFDVRDALDFDPTFDETYPDLNELGDLVNIPYTGRNGNEIMAVARKVAGDDW